MVCDAKRMFINGLDVNRKKRIFTLLGYQARARARERECAREGIVTGPTSAVIWNFCVC